MFKQLKLRIRNNIKIIVSILLLTGFLIWLLNSDYPNILNNRFVQGKVKSYGKVSIGDNKETVFYKMGQPSFQLSKIPCRTLENCQIFILDENLEGDDENFIVVDDKYDFKKNNFWMYGDFENNTFIQFDSKETVNGIRCVERCDPLLGVRVGYTEDRVLKILGKPTRSKIEGGQKRLFYDNLNVRILLRMSKVTGFELKISKIK